MSLLDDVSIVVTPNGYKAGTLYGVLPVPTEGSELVVNGDFATDSVWNKGSNWTIGSGLATRTSGVTSNISQVISGIGGKLLKVSYTVSSYGGGNIGASPNGSDFNANTGNGTFTDYITPTGNNLYIRASYSFSGSIDNVSVKEFTASDMDVTRATAATRVDENGLVNYAEVLGSEEVTNGDFSNGTTNWQVSDYGGTAASASLSVVDGAVKILKTANSDWRSSFLRQTISYTSGSQYKVTFKIKNGDAPSASIYVRNGYDSSGQTIKSGIALTSSFVEHTYYFTADSNSVDISFGNVTWQNAGTGQYFFIDDVTVKEVTRNNVPRIDYTGGGCPHILAEPQRTNIVTYSEDFTQSVWNKTNTTVQSGFVSPNGTENAYKLKEDTSTAEHFIQSIISVSNATIYTTSIFVKYAGRAWVRFTDAQSSNRIHFNTQTGVFGAITGTVISYNKTALENGWYKLSFTTTSVATAYAPRLSLAEADNDVSYTGDGSSGVYIYGAQLEEGSYPTSYIPTSGSTVTRNKDVFTRDGIASLINSEEGVLFVEMAALVSLNDDENTVSLSDGTNINTIRLQFNTLNNNVRVFVGNGNTQVNSNITISDITAFNKFAFKYKQNDFALWINGSEVITDTSGNTFAAGTLNKLGFVRGDNTEYLFGKVRQLQVYKTALTDAQLTSLTS